MGRARLRASGMPIRETASILVRAPRDRVFALLERRVGDAPGLVRVPSQRLESRQDTFVLRDEAEGTRVVLARQEPGFAFAPRPREALRQSVADELLTLQRLVDATQ